MIKNKTQEEKGCLSMQDLYAENNCSAREYKKDSCKNKGLKKVTLQ